LANASSSSCRCGRGHVVAGGARMGHP
jgi:hypothetical protein